MFLRQLFDQPSSTYTYLLADKSAGEAVIIDPVVEHTEEYLKLLEAEQLTLKYALDTHVHADHVTALGALRQQTGTQTYLGKPGDVACADNPLEDGQMISFGQYELEVMYTPGHTDDSYCFLVSVEDQRYLFTGDTLLIGGTGRTDFQNGDPSQLFDSLNQRLLTLPDDTVVYPAHDYHGKTDSTIGHEKATNQRINIKNRAVFIDFMNNLKLPNPKQMDIAVPANKSCGNSLV